MDQKVSKLTKNKSNTHAHMKEHRDTKQMPINKDTKGTEEIESGT